MISEGDWVVMTWVNGWWVVINQYQGLQRTRFPCGSLPVQVLANSAAKISCSIAPEMPVRKGTAQTPKGLADLVQDPTKKLKLNRGDKCPML